MTLLAACESIITVDDLHSCDCKLESIVPPLTDEQIEDLLDAACNALANITHLPVGRCSTVWRPCLERCHYWGCPCGCSPSGIPLPGIEPVVTKVEIDGVVLAPAAYSTVVSPFGRSLERIDGQTWPVGQYTAKPPTAVGTFAVTVESGLYPDDIMRAAAAEIACDILTLFASEQRQPIDGATSATGYGSTISFQRFGDPTDQQTMNLAGLGWVRRFVASVGAINQTAIISNDMLRGWSMYEVV